MSDPNAYVDPASSQASDPAGAASASTPADATAQASAAPAALDYGALADALIARGAVSASAPATSAAPSKPKAATNLFTKGQVVTYTAPDHYAGGRPLTTYGVVVDTLPDEGQGARSLVVWLGDRPALIGDHELEAG